MQTCCFLETTVIGLNTLLKTTTDSINKAEDETALTTIKDQFTKEFDEKCIYLNKLN